MSDPSFALNYPAPGIQVQDLTLRYGPHTVFENLKFTLAGGQFTSLLGASGVGKTSLLKIIAGLARPDSGSVTVSDGHPIGRRIAYMGQKDLLFPWLTIGDNVTLSSRLRGEKPDRKWATDLLERVGLAEHVRARPAALSGGMRQRAALARTLYQRQPIVLMDEPFSSLDTLTRTRIQTLAAELLSGCTVLLITHDPMEACRLSHRLLVLSSTAIDESQRIVGIPPRSPDDPLLLQSQGELLGQLVRAAQ